MNKTRGPSDYGMFGPKMWERERLLPLSQTGADGPNSIRSTNRGPGQKGAVASTLRHELGAKESTE